MTALAAPPSIGGNKTLMDTFLIDVPMPSMGATVNELTVVTLKIQPGARVTKGQKIGELESDKSVFEFESPCDGTVRSIQVHPGEARPSGATFLQIETSDASLQHLKSKSGPVSYTHLDVYKRQMFCNVPVKAVIECRDVDSSIYQLPLALQKERMDELVLDLLGFSIPAPKKNIWIEIVRRLLNPKHEVTIGVVGKYIELQDAYKSVYESIAHAGIANTCKVNVRRIDAEDLEKKGGMKLLKGLDGILVPGGFGDRGTDGKIAAARFAREKGVPYYGLCLGLQIAVIEIARNVLKIAGANSTEFDPKCVDPVINMMEEQKAITDKGATMRLGSYDCALTPGTLAAKAYGATMVRERHRHRYEVNNAYLDVLKPVMVVSGINPKRNLVEIMELKGHPWFVGVQFHPEFQSKPNRAHPLFAAFIAAAIRHRRAAKPSRPGKGGRA